MDVNGDGHLSVAELRALVVGMQLNDINLNEDDAIDKVMKEFDTSGDEEVDFREFITGIANWLEEARRTKISYPISGPDHIHDYHEVCRDAFNGISIFMMDLTYHFRQHLLQ